MACSPVARLPFLTMLALSLLVSQQAQSQAQVIPDATLGAESSLVNLIDLLNQRIDGGALRGSNLFHSFQEFSVQDGRGVYFANPAGVMNIFSRVTGANPSQIMGILGVQGNANLFFLNPNGILFGPNARLDLRGSFVGTTADSFIFDNGYQFSASNPTTPPLLTINVPIGLGFGSNPGDITVQTGKTQNTTATEQGDAGQLPGEAQAINQPGSATPNSIFGTLSEDNDADLYQVYLPEGTTITPSTVGGSKVDTRLFLFDQSGLGLVANDDIPGNYQSTLPKITQPGFYYLGISSWANSALSKDGPIFTFFPDGFGPGASAPLSGWNNGGLESGSYTISLIPPGTGNLAVNPGQTLALIGGNVTVDGGKIISPGSNVYLGSIKANGVVPLVSRIQPVLPDNLTRGDISMMNNALVDVSSKGDFDGGNITLIGHNITTDNLLSFSRNNSRNGGVITLMSGGDLSTKSIDVRGLDNGGSGQIFLDSRSNISLNGDILAYSSTGNGGSVILIAEGNIFTKSIDTSTSMNIPIRIETLFGIPIGVDIIDGYNGGSIKILSKQGTIDSSAGTLNSSAIYENGALILGKAGDISLEANKSIVTGDVNASSNFTDGGNVQIISHKGSVDTSTGSILTWVSNLTEDVELNTVLGNFSFSAPSLGSGGNITIQAANNIKLGRINSSGGVGGIFELSGASSDISNLKEAGGGDITINSDNGTVSLDNNSIISSSYGLGSSGNITIVANEVSLINNAGLVTSTVGLGDSGEVSMNASSILLSNKSQVLTGAIDAAEEFGDAFQDSSIILDDVNNILSFLDLQINFEIPEINVETGKGGDVFLNATESIKLENQSAIATFTTGSGDAGKVAIKTPKLIANDSIITTVTFDDNNDLGIEGNGGNIIINSSTSLGDLISVGITGDSKTIPIKNLLSNFEDFIQEYAPDFNFEELPEIPMGIGSLSLSPGKAGEINISGKEIIIQNGAIISASAFESGDGSNLTINATESVSILNGSALFNATLGEGDAGNIDINFIDETTLNQDLSGILEIQDSSIATITFDLEDNFVFPEGGAENPKTSNSKTVQGSAGNINIKNAQSVEAIALSDSGFIDIKTPFPDNFIESPIGIFSLSQSEGDAGSINIQTDNLLLKDGAAISSSTFNEGLGGNITINAGNEIQLLGTSKTEELSSAILAQTSGSGDAQDVIINTPRLIVKGGGIISTATGSITAQQNLSENTGNAGDLIIQNAELIELSGTSPSLEFRSSLIAGTASQGDGGSLVIDSKNIVIENGALIVVATIGKGNSNILQIDAESIIVRGTATDDSPSGISGGTAGSGDGNDVKITTNSLKIENGAVVTAGAFNEGDGGQLIINSKTIVIEGYSSKENRSSQLNASSGIKSTIPILLRFTDPSLATGDAGNIQIYSNNIIVRDGGEISTQTIGEGNAGTIKIQAEIIELNTQGKISASTAGGGNADNIFIDTNQLVASKGSSISAFTEGSGSAGSITINSPQVINVGENSRISVETSAAGKPGDISITTDNLTLGTNAQLSATATETSTNAEGGGSITLNTQTLNIAGRLGIFAETQGQTPAGNLIIQPNNNHPDLNIRFTDKGFISARTTAGGQGGNIDISAPNAIDIRGQGKITAETSGAGNAGSIQFTSQALNLADGVEVSATTSGAGKAGNIRVNTPIDVTIGDKSRLTVETTAAGDAGNIDISTNRLTIGQDAELSARTRKEATGKAGNITLAADQLNVSGELGIFAETEGVADAGNLSITPQSSPNLTILFTQAGNISARTKGLGNGGNISITAPDRIDISGNGNITVATQGSGNAGNIILRSQRLQLKNGVNISATTSGSGNAGTLQLDAPQQIALTSSTVSSSVESKAQGNAGEITLNTADLSLQDGSQISAASDGQGSAGSINIPSAEKVSLDNSIISTAIESQGEATQQSDITISTQTLKLTNQSEITTSTAGKGNAGIIELNAPQQIALTGSTVSSRAESKAQGNAGEITLNTADLSLQEGSQISAASDGQGSAGSINIPSAQKVSLDNSTISTAIESQGEATQQSDITISTQTLTLTNQSEITTSTAGKGNAGIIELNSPQQITLTGSKVSSSVESKAQGNAGEITLNTADLSLQDGSQISAASDGQGSAGSINIPSAEKVSLDNSTISTAILPQGIANRPSNISLNSNNLTLQNNATIEANSQGLGNAGDINLNLKNNLISTDSRISTAASQSAGGQITAKAANIRLQGNSDIRTNVNSGAGGGGNITLTADSILAFKDSDILAFARDGRGGNITLSTPVFFGDGYQPLAQRTNPDSLDNNGRVDINASGAVFGVITIPDLTFIQNSLAQFPDSLIDPNQLIANSCVVRDRNQQGTFIITGPGGLPPRPGDAQIAPYPLEEVEPLPTPSQPQSWQEGDPIVEAQGFYRSRDGRLLLSRECP